MARTKWTSDGRFEVEVGSAEYKRLLSEGHELVSDQPDGDALAPPADDEPFEAWKFPQLKAKASELGILEHIEGTGKSGAVTKGDLVQALEQHAAEHPGSEGETLGEGGE